jgi:NAD(P)H-hydrate epimerase
MSTFWLSRDEVRELDRRSIQEYGVPGIVLMENAGRGCAELLMRLNPERKPVAILCGPGNNGGDGYVIARHLDNQGWKVNLCGVDAPSRNADSAATSPKTIRLGFTFEGLPPDALLNFSIVSHDRERFHFFPINSGGLLKPGRDFLTDLLLKPNCWIVDALFGTGLSRSLGPPYDELVSIMNSSPNPVLAVDIPSGLDCDSGQPLGPTVKAAHTATFVGLKKGFMNPASNEWTGEVHVVDIGAPRTLVDQYRQRRR